MNRRAFLFTAAAAAKALSAAPRTRMGIAVTSYMGFRRPKDTYEFLERAYALGAGGIQMPLTSMEPDYARKLRARAGQLGMYYEVIAGLPKDDPSVFEGTVAAAKEAGAGCIRVNCLSGRRYETFTSMAEWREFAARSRQAIDVALRIVEKHQVPLAVENHKDWTVDELAALMKEKESRWLGVCLDTGNNISLLDDPMATVEALAPYALCTHIKDMAVEPYPDGFLLSEAPLGEGMLDMRRIVDTIHRARPETHMTLEMITRDPLKVPCLTDNYWLTFPDRSGRYLARTLRMARDHGDRRPLPVPSALPLEARARLAEDNVHQCLNYAREHLGL